MKAITLALLKNSNITSSFKKLVNRFVQRFDEPHEKLFFNLLLIGIYAGIYRFISFLDKKSFSEPLDINNSLYFASITNFTLGYGDILPKTPLAKFAVVSHSLIFWMIAIA